MNQLGGFPFLTLIVFLPGLGAAVTALIRASRSETWRWLAFLIATATLFISLFLYMGWVDNPNGALQFVDGPADWLPTLGAHYYLGIDGINLHLVMLTTLFIPLLLLLTWTQGNKAFAIWALLMETGILGALTSFDLILFFAFWLLAMLSVFFLLGHPAQDEQDSVEYMAPAVEFTAKKSSLQRSMQWLIALAGATACMTAVFAGLLAHHSSLDLADSTSSPLDWASQAWMFWVMMAAMGITGAVFPLHLFHIAARRQAPTAVQVLVSTLLVNLGVYGLIRLCLLLFPLAAVSFAPALVILGLLGSIYGAIAMLGSSRLEGTLFYWHVAQVGLAVVGIFCRENLGLNGVILLLISRALSGAALLILPTSTQAIETPRHATAQYAHRREKTIAALAFLSAMGMPGLAGFAGLSALLMGVLRWHWQVSAAAATNQVLDWLFYGAIAAGLIVQAWALLRFWKYIPTAPVQAIISRREWIVIILLLASLILGLRSQFFSDTIGPAVYRHLNIVTLGVEKSLRQMGGSPANESQELPTPVPGGESSTWNGFVSRTGI